MICITKFFKPVSKTPKIDSNEQNTELEQGPDIPRLMKKVMKTMKIMKIKQTK